jgi:hypothetical protein
MRALIPAAAIVLAAGAASAGGVDIKIGKNAIVASPVDARGLVTVQGLPGAVMGGMPPVRVVAQSKKTKLSNAGMVGPDGGFMVQVPSMLKDSIKLVFIGADGKKKDHTVKPPRAGIFPPQGPQAATETVTETMTIPAGGQLQPQGAPPGLQAPLTIPAGPPPPQADSRIVDGEKELHAAGIVE